MNSYGQIFLDSIVSSLATTVEESEPFEVTSSCLCKKVEGAGFPFQVKSLEDGIDDAIHTFYVHKTHHGWVRRRTSTKQRSIMLVVRSLRHRWRGKAKNESNSGRSCCNRRTMVG